MAGNNDKKGADWQQFQAAQMGVANSYAQRQQNFAAARGQVEADIQQNNTLYQAAQVMANAQLNPATQQTLRKYGVNKPQTVSQKSTQQQGHTTIINNNTTTNNYGGPVQGRELAFNQNQAVSKFKVWLENAFASQNALAARRSKEYEKRERTLLKDSNKLNRKLMELGKNLSEKMDPRRIGSTVTSQLKTLLFLFGFGTMAMNWKKILNVADSILGFFTGEKLDPQTGRVMKGEGSGFEKKVVALLGGENGWSVRHALRAFFFGNGNHKDGSSLGVFPFLTKTISDFFEVRGKEIEQIKRKKGFGIGGKIEAFLDYVSQVIPTLFLGSKFKAKQLDRDMDTGVTFQKTGIDADVVGHRSAVNSTKKLRSKHIDGFGWEGEEDGERNNTSIGAARVYNENTSFTIDEEHDLDRFGNLVSDDAAVLQSNQISRIIESGSGHVRPAEMLTGLSRLKNYANSNESNGYALVTQKFIDSILNLVAGKNKEKARNRAMRALINKGAKKVRYGFLRTKKSWRSRLDDNKGKSEEFTIVMLPLNKILELNSNLEGYGGLNRTLGERILTKIDTVTVTQTANISDDVKQELIDMSINPNTLRSTPINTTVTKTYNNDEYLTVDMWQLPPDALDALSGMMGMSDMDNTNMTDMSILEKQLMDYKLENFSKTVDANGKEIVQFTADTMTSDFDQIKEDNVELFDDVAMERILRERTKSNFSNSRMVKGFNNLFHHMPSKKGYEIVQSENLQDFIDNATTFIRQDANGTDNYGGWCARGVSRALNHAGMPYPGKDAKDYLQWAINNGYEIVETDDGDLKYTDENFKPLPGDISCQVSHDGTMQHVAMFDGANWVSDTIQTTRPGVKGRNASFTYQNMSDSGKLKIDCIVRPTDKVMEKVKGYNKDAMAEAENKLIDEEKPVDKITYSETSLEGDLLSKEEGQFVGGIWKSGEEIQSDYEKYLGKRSSEASGKSSNIATKIWDSAKAALNITPLSEWKPTATTNWFGGNDDNGKPTWKQITVSDENPMTHYTTDWWTAIKDMIERRNKAGSVEETDAKMLEIAEQLAVPDPANTITAETLVSLKATIDSLSATIINKYQNELEAERSGVAFETSYNGNK